MTVHLPDGWRSVSQGRRLAREPAGGETLETWQEQRPQEEVYLIAAPFTECRQLGDQAFVQGLRRFYRDNAFKIAGWAQVVEAFNSDSDTPLDAFFDQGPAAPAPPSCGWVTLRSPKRTRAFASPA